MILPEAITHVVYHDNCMDGFGAAWVAWHFNRELIFIPAQYGNPPPKLPEGAVVACLDFSYPRGVLRRLRQKARVVVVDHHATAAEDLQGEPDVVMDMEHSGAVLAWGYFFPDLDFIPPMLRYIEDRDLWKFALPDSADINAFLQSWPKNFPFWEVGMNATTVEYAAQQGRSCQQIKLRGVEAQYPAFLHRFVGGRMIPMANCSLYYSELCDMYLDQHPEEEVAGYFFQRGDGLWQFGLRSRGDFHCGDFARQFGGGGHARAAGYVRAWSPWSQFPGMYYPASSAGSCLPEGKIVKRGFTRDAE